MTKVCLICNEKIIEQKEKWVRLTDFHKKKQTGEVFYHLECWRDRFQISNSIRKQKMYAQAQQAIGSIIENVKPILDKNKSGSEKFYEVYQIN